MVSPCCCMSLDRGVKIIAIVSLLWTCALIAEETILVVKYGCQGLQKIQEQNPEFGEIVGDEEPLLDIPTNKSSINVKHEEVKLALATAKKMNRTGLLEKTAHTETSICSMTKEEIAVSCVWVASWVCDVILALILIYGAHVRSIKLCLIWFYIRCAILVFRIIFLVMYFVTGLPLLAKIPVILLFIFRFYSLWVVNCYTNELTTEKEAKSKGRIASRVDLQLESEKSGIDNPIGVTPLW